jgi:hypothetical protein
MIEELDTSIERKKGHNIASFFLLISMKPLEGFVFSDIGHVFYSV